MSLIERRTEPTKKELTSFGLLLLAFSVAVGILLWQFTGWVTTARVVWTAGAGIAVVYYALPVARRPIFGAWMSAAYPIGWATSHALLALVYFGVMTPIAVLMRLVGYDPMNRRLDREALSYWTPRQRDAPVRRYFRQF